MNRAKTRRRGEHNARLFYARNFLDGAGRALRSSRSEYGRKLLPERQWIDLAVFCPGKVRKELELFLAGK